MLHPLLCDFYHINWSKRQQSPLEIGFWLVCQTLVPSESHSALLDTDRHSAINIYQSDLEKCTCSNHINRGKNITNDCFTAKLILTALADYQKHCPPVLQAAFFLSVGVRIR